MHSFFSELRALIRSCLKWAGLIVGLATLFFSIGIGTLAVWGMEIPIPVLTQHSIAASTFERVVHDLLPQGVTLVAMNPLDAFIIQMEIALLLAVIVLSPFFIFSVLRYLGPALYPRERRALALILLPVSFLFALGALFVYLIVIPQMYHFLYAYIPALGVEAYFSAREFIAHTISLMVVGGVMFELPIAMMSLSYIGIIPGAFWRKQWAWALLTFLVATAIITPDGSGISMALLSAPLMGLYAIGLTVSERRDMRRARREQRAH